jgi:ATP-binding cassette subfamily B protein
MTPLRRLPELLGPYRGRLAFLSLFWIAAALLPLIPPRLIGWAFDRLGSPDVAWIAVALLAAELSVLTAVAVKDFGAVRISEEFIAAIRRRLFGHLQRLGPDYVADRGAATLGARLHGGTRELEDLFSAGVGSVLLGPVTLIGSAIVLAWMDPMMMLTAMLPIPLMYLALGSFSARMRGVREAIFETDERVQQTAQQKLAGLSASWIFGRRADDAAAYDAQVRRLSTLRLFVARLSSIYFPLSAFLVASGTVLVLVRAGVTRLTTGELVAFIAYLAYFYRPALSVTRAYQVLSHVRAALGQIFAVLDAVPQVVEGRGAAAEGALELDGVTFAYPGRPPVFSGLTLRIEPGTCVGFRGPTGCGKSTLASLMARLREPTSGTIRLGGTALRDVAPATVVLVEQEPWIFRDAVRANIAYGRPEAGDAEIRAAAEAAAVDLEGWTGTLGDAGAGLSAGQLRRVAIARALLARPKVLILDEATSPLDLETERRVLAGVRACVPTLVIFSHRPSALEGCARVYEWRDGAWVCT